MSTPGHHANAPSAAGPSPWENPLGTDGFEFVEYTATGTFLAQMPVDPNNGGAFGLAVNNLGWGTIQLPYVDDNANSLSIRTVVVP